MIRPKNFRELRKSIITQKDKSNQIQYCNTQLQADQCGATSFKKISINSSDNITQHQENSTPNCTSPIRPPFLQKDSSYKSPSHQAQVNYQYDLRHITPNNQKPFQNNTSSKKRKVKDGTKNSFLQFEGQTRKKLNFHHLPQKFVKERLSSKKKQSILGVGTISFKSIIENSPQCRQTERQLKYQNKESEFNLKYAQTDRQADRKSSITKLKNQFGGIKKNIEHNIKEMNNAQPIFTEIILDKTKYDSSQPEVICFTKKITKRNSNSGIYKENIEQQQKYIFQNKKIEIKMNTKTQYYNPFNNNKQIYQSLTDIVNISRDSELDSQSSELDMSPCL